MTLIIPEDQLSKTGDLPAAGALQETDLLLLTRPGASMRASVALLRDFLASALMAAVAQGFAPIDSPTLTGTPMAPTADMGTADDGQIATAGFVRAVAQVLQLAIENLSAESIGADPSGAAQQALQGHLDATDPHGDRAAANAAIAQAIANLVNTAPSTLDTLNELAAALGNDPNFATTISMALGFRVRFDAPQILTAEQQAQARANIGAAAQSDLSGLSLSLGYTLRFDTDTQGLTAGQKANALANLGLGSNITQINGLTPGANAVLQYVGGAWSARTPAQLKTTLSLTAADVSGVQAAITASGLLKGDGAGGVTAAVAGADYADPNAVANQAKTNGYLDDFLDITESNTRSINSTLGAITCAELTAANLNWIGAARIKATMTGGYYRAFTLVKSNSDTFTFQPSRGAVEACATLYIPACNSGSSVFMGLVKDSVQSLGDPAKLVVLQYDAGTSENWRLRKTDGTFVDTGVAFALSTEVHLRVKLSGTTCTAYINGNLVATATVTASDATTYMASFGLTHAGGGSNDVDIWADYLGHQQTLNAARANFGFT